MENLLHCTNINVKNVSLQCNVKELLYVTLYNVPPKHIRVENRRKFATSSSSKREGLLSECW